MAKKTVRKAAATRAPARKAGRGKEPSAATARPRRKPAAIPKARARRGAPSPRKPKATGTDTSRVAVYYDFQNVYDEFAQDLPITRHAGYTATLEFINRYVGSLGSCTAKNLYLTNGKYGNQKDIVGFHEAGGYRVKFGPFRKDTDTTMAADLLDDASRDAFDVSVVITGDSDFIAPLGKVKERGKQIHVLCMKGTYRSDGIKPCAHAFVILPEVCPTCRGRGHTPTNCRKCRGTGHYVIPCRPCHGRGHKPSGCSSCRGTGRLAPPALCPACEGYGFDLARVCTTCGGTGARNGNPCPDCKGAGRGAAPCRKCSGTGVFPLQICSACQGRGYTAPAVCPQCHGRGEVDKGECWDCRGTGHSEPACPGCRGTGLLSPPSGS